MRSITVFFCLISLHLGLIAQVPGAALNKMSVPLRNQLAKLPEGGSVFYLRCTNIDSFHLSLENFDAIRIVREYPAVNVIVLKTNARTIQELAKLGIITFLDVHRAPKEESIVNNLDVNVNRINQLRAAFPFFDGKGMHVSIKENLFDTTDIDFLGRYQSSANASKSLSGHATDMASIIGGAGNRLIDGAGVARAASLSSSSFELLLPDKDQEYQQQHISIQNHSYGTGIENYYGAEAAAYDASTYANPFLLHVFSAGNAGADRDTTGRYKNIDGYANLTGNFKMAKNIVTVGNTNPVYQVLPRSSRGPAYDGRIKPELVAFAEDGSSAAAAMVSGTALLLQEAYQSAIGLLPPASLLKAVLVNSAFNTGNGGISFTTGFGNLDGYKAMQTIQEKRYVNDVVSKGSKITYQLHIPRGVGLLKVTLSWTDPPALPNATSSLINDLDLSLQNNTSLQTWLPWVLNSMPDADSLRLPATRKRDSINNTEQISIQEPVAGEYTIVVNGYSIKEGQTQPFSFSWQLDSVNTLGWTYPSLHDKLIANQSNIIRWTAPLSAGNGSLAYSMDQGSHWLTIADNVLLDAGYYKWLTPDTNALAMLRFMTSAGTFYSSSFVISTAPSMGVALNCQDSLTLSWKAMKGVDSFNVSTIDNGDMASLLMTADSFTAIPRSAIKSPYFSVTPIIKHVAGKSAYTINYEQARVGCYVNQATAHLVGDGSELSIEMGSLFNIQSIQIEKLQDNSFKTLFEITLPVNPAYQFYDSTLVQGLNSYRVDVTLANGQQVFGDRFSVYYSRKSIYSIFPNPAQLNTPLVLTSNHTRQSVLQIFSNDGRYILEQVLNPGLNFVSTKALHAGLYFMRVLDNNHLQTVLKCVLY